MDWLKKTKEKAKEKLSKQRANLSGTKSFQGSGNVLGSAAMRDQETNAAPPPAPDSESKISRMLTKDQMDRRDQMRSAAESRSAQWDNRLKKSRKNQLQKQRAQHQSTLHEKEVGGHSEAFLELKRQEEESTEKLGFNPYLETFSSSTEARRTHTRVNDGRDDLNSAELAAENCAESPSSAIQALLAGGQSSFAVVQAIEILEKLVGNILKDPTNAKFHRIRLSNPKIQSIVVPVPGALEFLCEIGFRREQHSEELAILVPSDNSGLGLGPFLERIERAVNQLEVAKSCILVEED